jgi:hypothetical protein
LLALGASMVLLCGVAAARSPDAYASWAGGNCSREIHCYAATEWCPSTEKNITDAWVYEDTTSMTVPKPKESRVNNEMWLAWTCENNGEWIEGGQSAGYPRGTQHKIYPFYAKRSNGVYEEFESETEVAPNRPNLYKFYRAKEGEWCVDWGSALERCYSGFKSGPAQALEEGVEAADDAEPTNNGVGEGFALGGVNNWWQGSVKSKVYSEPGTCSSEHQPGPGSLNYGAGKGC